jgi:phosphatidate cytidylyltransferase
LKSRVLTAIGLIPFVLGAFFCVNPWPLAALTVVALLFATVELEALLSFRARLPMVAFSLLAAAIALKTPALEKDSLSKTAVSVGILAVLGAYAGYLRAKSRNSLPGAVLAPLWIVCSLFSLNALHGMVQSSALWSPANPILMAVVPLWGGDTAAYFVGKKFGKRLLAPKVSPKKTVEGGIANVLACLVVAIPLGHSLGFSWTTASLCGLSAGVFGQFGDLFESYLKRQANIKDSGSLLPGHGGILDRIDSILFTAPLVFAIIALGL